MTNKTISVGITGKLNELNELVELDEKISDDSKIATLRGFVISTGFIVLPLPFQDAIIITKK